MSNKKIFISGSISIKKLNNLMIDSIDKIIENGYEILIGDAPGIDTLVQDYLVSKNYFNVIVYSIYSSPRYISNNSFRSNHIFVSNEIKNERERQTYKDKQMSDDSDYSLVLWDGKSKGSYSNILRAIDSNKYVKVFYSVKNHFLEKNKTTKEEIEFIYREYNGYTASEVVEYLKNIGVERFKKTQDLNKYLLEKNVIKKEDKIYVAEDKYKDLLIIELYKGKPKGVKFNNDFITWIEEDTSSSSYQGELF